MARIRRIVRPIAAITVLAVVGSFAVAGSGGLKLNWTLAGPAHNGVVPSGKADLGESSLPGQFQMRVDPVNILFGGETIMIGVLRI